MNDKKNFEGFFVQFKTIRLFVNWDEQYIALTYEDAVDFSRESGMIPDFCDWLLYHNDYSVEDIFEMNEDDKAKVKAGYDKYVQEEIAEQWEVKEITI